MKTFQQFMENAYADPKNTAKVAKEYEKTGAKFPDAQSMDQLKKYTSSISDFKDPQAGFKNFLDITRRAFTRKTTPIVGRDTKYVNPNTSRRVIKNLKQDFKQKNKFNINKNKNLKVIKNPMITPNVMSNDMIRT
tara:strand:- start:127 stop:531 length:405 start_codon:yes stop_codon:yes gene_type:complete